MSSTFVSLSSETVTDYKHLDDATLPVPSQDGTAETLDYEGDTKERPRESFWRDEFLPVSCPNKSRSSRRRVLVIDR